MPARIVSENLQDYIIAFENFLLNVDAGVRERVYMWTSEDIVTGVNFPVKLEIHGCLTDSILNYGD
jgi:hypothetical protein